MTIASSTVPLLGLVDTAILGHLDHPRYLAAVAAGGSIMTFIGWLFAFLRMGNTGLTAQASGSGDTDRNREILFQSAGLGLLLGAALILLHTPLLHLAVALIKPSPDVQLLTYEYCRIRIFAAPATFFSFAAIGWLLGNQRARACLVILVVTNMANIALDFV
ncbi:MAG: MATE family efflux transporter, partial [bacterium]